MMRFARRWPAQAVMRAPGRVMARAGPITRQSSIMIDENAHAPPAVEPPALSFSKNTSGLSMQSTAELMRGVAVLTLCSCATAPPDDPARIRIHRPTRPHPPALTRARLPPPSPAARPSSRGTPTR